MNELKENTGRGNMTLPSITCSGTIKHHHETLIGMAQDALEEARVDAQNTEPRPRDRNCDARRLA